MKKKLSIILLFIFVILIIVALSLIMFSNDPNSLKKYDKYDLKLSNAYVTQSITYLDKVKRNLPDVSNGGLDKYPLYDNKDSFDDEYKKQILDENILLIPSSTTYDSMDREGNLFLNGEAINRKLYKHSASFGMYGGDVSDLEEAYSAKVSITARGLGNYISGLYAPAGEIIKITISEEDLKKTGGFEIIIGQVSARGHTNDIPSSKNYSRMPMVTSKFRVTTTECYVGSFFGGPIYIGEPSNISATFSVEISGGVKYGYYLLGETTEERYLENMKSTAPYFDLEVFNDGVRHSGPKYLINDLDYEDINNAAILWYNLASVSNRISSASHSLYGVSFLYDTYVLAGAAVALVGANWCNLPLSWFRSALDYETFIKEGSWGVVHEYNHHYQMFGIVRGAETTNNAVSLIEYALFTEISKYRSEDDKSLTGWNPYTSGYRATRININEINNKTTPIQSLDLYATLLHSFGPKKMLDIASQSSGGGLDNFFKAVTNVTKMDMTYYFENMLNQPISADSKEYAKQFSDSPFIPAGLLYANGRYLDDYLDKTERAYNIESGKILDFEKYLVLPTGFNIKDIVINTKDGRISHDSDYRYKVDFFEKCTLTVEVLLDDNILNISSIKFNVDLEDYQLTESKIDVYDNPYENIYEFSGTVNQYKIIEESVKNFTPWDENYKIDNLVDGVNSRFMHSKNIITEDKPFEIILDLSKNVNINYMNFYGYNKSNNEHLPLKFEIYCGVDLNDLSLLEYTSERNGKNLKINFSEINIRYIKLIVSKTSTDKYIALDYIDIGYYKENIISKSPDILEYYYAIDNKSNVLIHSHEFIFGHAIKVDKIIYEANSLFGILAIGNGTIEVNINDNVRRYNVNSEKPNIVFIETFDDLEYKNIEITLISGSVYITNVLLANE